MESFTVALFLTKSILNLRDSSTSKPKRQVNAFSNICPTLHHTIRYGLGVGHTNLQKIIIVDLKKQKKISKHAK